MDTESYGNAEHSAFTSPNYGGLVGLLQAELGNTGQAAFSLGAFVPAPMSLSIDYPAQISAEAPPEKAAPEIAEEPLASAGEMLLMMEAGDALYTADFDALLDEDHAFGHPAQTEPEFAEAAEFDWISTPGFGRDAGHDEYSVAATAQQSPMEAYEEADYYSDADLSFDSTDSFIFYDQEA